MLHAQALDQVAKDLEKWVADQLAKGTWQAPALMAVLTAIAFGLGYWIGKK